MTLTTSELRDMVSSTIISYLAEVRGDITVDECVNLVKWVDSHDFETCLEVMREDW